MEPAPSSFRLDRRFVLAVFGLWAVFTLVVIVVTWVGMWVKSGTWNFENQVIWESGWFGWAWMSLLVFAVARRYPLDRRRVWVTASRLAAIGLVVVAVQIAWDFVVITTLGMTLQNYEFRWAHYLYVAAYKGHAYYAVYWMVVGVAHAIEYHRRYRDSQLVASRLEAKLATAELGRLKSQLQPHFLFNAHNAIVSLMLKRENETAVRVLTRLSDLLRLSLSRSGQQLVTLREELETLGLYLDIQRERFRDRLTVAIDVPAELGEAEVPHLLLQPLVENAFQHGLEQVAENGRIEIAAWREGEVLACEIRDNGAGLPEFRGGCAPANGFGIGLANSRERLQQLYGDRQSLTIGNAPGGGCTVTVRLPWRLRAVEPSGSVVASA